jgi:hypothetical protein
MRFTAEFSLMRALRRLALPALLALALGCAPTVKHLNLFGKDPEHVWLVYGVEKDGSVTPQGFQHPAKFTAEQIDDMLTAVRYGEDFMYAWRDRGRVFFEAERAKLAPWLADALGRATPDQWVHFAITSMKTELLFKTLRMSDGACFVKDGKFNLVMANLNYEVIEPDHDLFIHDPRDRSLFGMFRLTPMPEKGIEAPPVVKGDKYLNTAHRNWLTIDTTKFFEVLAQERKAAPPATPPPVEAPPLTAPPVSPPPPPPPPPGGRT